MISFEDIEQLNFKISQCLESYGARIGNCGVITQYANSQRDTFSSFERFKLYNSGAVSPTTNINISNDCLIVPAGSAKTLQYRIEIDLPSPVGIQVKSKSDRIGAFEYHLIFHNLHGHSRISYVDYAAARHFQAQIKEWVDGLTIHTKPKFLSILQSHSHYFRSVVPLVIQIAIFVSAYLFLKNPEITLGAGTQFENSILAQFSILIIAAIFVSSFFGMIVGRIIETSIDRLQPLSYVKLNRGDEIAIKKAEKNNSLRQLIAIGGVVTFAASAIGLNLLSSYLFSVYF